MRPLWLLAAVLCLLGHPTPVRAEVLAQVSTGVIADLMKEEGYATTIDKDGDLVWKIDGVTTLLLLDPKAKAISFRVSYKNERTTLKMVNDWNRTTRFSQSYLDDEGDPVLQSDLQFEGGITRERVLDYLRLCRRLLEVWTKEVL